MLLLSLAVLVAAPVFDISYVVSLAMGGASYVSVVADFHSDERRPLTLTVGAGSNYPFQRFGRYVERLSVKADGKPITPSRISEDRWQVPGTMRHCTATYRIRLDHIQAPEKPFAHAVPVSQKTFLTFPSIAFFLRPVVDGSVRSAKVEFRTPKGWEVATNFDKVGARTYRTAAPERFSQYSYFALGRFRKRQVALGDGLLQIVQCGRYRFPGDRFLEVASKAVQAVHKFYGSLPQKRLLLIACPVPGSRVRTDTSFGGSVSNWPGMSMMLGLDEKMDEKALRREIALLILHETFHLGNPNFASPETWFTEGFTSYYEMVLGVRSGFLTAREFVTRLADMSLNHRAVPKVSLKVAGTRMFESDAYLRDVYSGGALLAFQLDLALRERGSSLDALIRRLFADYAVKDRQLSVTALAEMIRKLSDVALSPLVDRFVTGDEWPGVELLLYEMGHSVEVDGRRYEVGLVVRQRGERVLVESARNPASDFGVKAGDQILAIDGHPVESTAEFLRYVRAGPAGGAFRLALSRAGKAADVEVVPVVRRSPRIEPVRANPEKKALLEAILSSR